MTNQIESPDGKPRKDGRPSPDVRGVADGATGTTVNAAVQTDGSQAVAVRSGVKGATQGFEEAAEGKRSGQATSNQEQARAVGLDPVRDGSRQGKDADRGDPGRVPPR